MAVTLEARSDPAKRRFDWDIMDVLFALSIASLFSSIFYNTSFVKLRLFEVFGCFAVIGAFLKYGPKILNFPSAYALLCVFFVVHAASAYAFGVMNGLRETAQMIVIFFVLLAMITHYRVRNPAPMLEIVSICLIIIIIYDIYWHVARGHYAGWKRVDDMKFAFSLIPVMLSGWVARSKSSIPVKIAVLAAAALIVLLSGERKAYAVAAAALVVSFGFLSTRLQIAAAAVVLAALIAVWVDPGGYVAHQVHSITTPEVNRNWATLTNTDTPQSISNAQRSFGSEMAWAYFKENPLLGVGTNKYVSVLEDQFWYLPKYMRTSVHNEFQRVAVENGLLGLSIYLTCWSVALWRLLKATDLSGWRHGLESTDRTRAILFAACFMFCFVEASKTLSFVALAFAMFSDVFVRRLGTVARTFTTRPHISRRQWIADRALWLAQTRRSHPMRDRSS